MQKGRGDTTDSPALAKLERKIMDDLIAAHFGSIVIVSVCAIVFILALVATTYKEELEKLNKNASKIDPFNDNICDWLEEQERRLNEDLDTNPACSFLAGNSCHDL